MILIRLVWFCLAGWWLAGLWLALTLVATLLLGLVAGPELARMYRFTRRLAFLA